MSLQFRIVLFLFLPLVGTIVHGQIDTTRKEFFPLHVGDLWQYTDEFGHISGTLQVVTLDTLLPNGYRYAAAGVPPNFSTGYSFLRIDTLLRVQSNRGGGGDSCGGTAPREISTYRLNEPVGTAWRDCLNFGGYLTSRTLVRYNGISQLFVFGQSRDVMTFRFGGVFPQPVDTSYGSSGILVRGIGLYRQEYHERMGFDQLTGALINGVTYGRIVAVDEIARTTPDQTRLYQNYPNPFNSATTLRYEVSEALHVQLMVFDVLGREVIMLADSDHSPGSYEVQFQSENVASGVYFYRLLVGRELLTRKMIIQK